MGGSPGSQVELIIAGENIDDSDELYFSDARITATRKLNAEGRPETNKYVIAITADCPIGLYEARVMTRLGISSSRVFSVGALPEVLQVQPNMTLATAMPLTVNTVCNGVMSAKSVNHYSFEAVKGKRYVVDCAAKGIDSKLDAVLIVADAEGKDLLVERRGGMLDFTAPSEGKYVIKVHELTFRGGPEFFYRLSLQELPADAPLPTPQSTRTVSSFSWPPEGLAATAADSELEPNNSAADSQRITLPCDITGSFFPAADVDRFEFLATKGEVWWVELASERLGLPTDASVLVQQVVGDGAEQKLVDVAEFGDIPSPVKVSTNGYAYDGPPYNAGSSDVLGKLEIKEDGTYRLQVTDLFGGTRSDTRNVYRLVVRQPASDFALVAWPLHMELRNGDRSAFSKPIALRGGATMAIEVVALRRDGFDGDINLIMEGLPEGVRARGLKIAAGSSRGVMLISADVNAPRSLANAKFIGKAIIGEVEVSRPCRMAEMKWPVADSWSEIPETRLVADVPVSVSGFENTPLSIVAAESKTWEVKQGEKLKLPLVHTRRSEFSGTTLQLRAFGQGFERTPQFDVSIASDSSEATLDTAALKIMPGDYQVAFYGGAVAKYRYCPEAIPIAELALKQAKQAAEAVDVELRQRNEDFKAAAIERKAELAQSIVSVTDRQKAAIAAVTAAAAQVKSVTDKAQPKDVVDIVVSEPIAVRVIPAEAK